MNRILVPHAVYHGCGQFWTVATLMWDDGTEVSEFWWYQAPLNEKAAA